MNKFFLDAHVHFQDISNDAAWGNLLAIALKADVRLFFCCSAAQSDWAGLSSLALSVPEIIPFFGIHPWNAASVTSDFAIRLEACLTSISAGIGEIGLDGLRGPGMDAQISVLKTQIAMAVCLQRPFVIHCVKAWGELRKVFDSFDLQGIPFILHGYSGSLGELNYYLSHGGYISIGPRNFQNQSSKSLDLIRSIPLDRLLVETDYPYLPGMPQSYIADDYVACLLKMYENIADIRNISTYELITKVWSNGLVISGRIV